MKNAKKACLAAIAFAGFAAARTATAQIFQDVTPTVTGGAQISGTQLVAGPPPNGTYTPVPVPLQTAALTGANQNLSAGANPFTTPGASPGDLCHRRQHFQCVNQCHDHHRGHR